MAKYRRNSQKRSKRPRVARKTYRRRRTALTRRIKEVVQSLNEDKMAYTTTGNSLIKFNSGIDAVGDLIQILPNISQGVGENQRIGNEIRAKNLNVKGYVKLDIGDIADNTAMPNVVVRMMILSMKVTQSYQDAQTLSSKIGTLLNKGGTTTAFAGNLQDIYAPINRNVFTVHHDKKFYLRQDFLNVIGAAPPSTHVAQDISKTVKFFNLNVKCKGRVLRYDEDVGSDVLPSNFGPFLVLGYSYLDGSSPDTLSTKVGLCFDSVFTYEDA